MKTIILIFALLFGFNTTVLAQNWKFILSGTTTDVTNTVQNKGVFNTDVAHLDFRVQNLTGGTVIARVSRKVIINPGIGWPEQVCLGNANGGFCSDLDSTVFNWTSDVIDIVTIDPDSTALANVKITPEPSEATGHYRYYLGVQGDLFQDSIDLIITSTVGVDEIEKELTLSVSPNPASEYVNIKVSNINNGNLKIVDVLGNVIKNSSCQGSKKLNISEFRNGIYFIMISGEGNNKSINKKLVVRHQ